MPTRASHVRPAVIGHGPRHRPRVALTFDADATAWTVSRVRAGRLAGCYDRAIVEILRETRTPATFFVTGRWAELYPKTLASLARDPLFEIGNHSYGHGAFTARCFGLAPVPESEKELEVIVGASVIAAATELAPRYFRFPGGCYDERDVDLVAGLGQQPVQWDVESGDAYERDPRAVARTILSTVQPGSIVVMHLNGPPHAPATAEAVRRVIPTLRARGLELVSLRRLLAPT
jgi:peptidoglycan/xylan/chitin deacetylase (PgdA/CDA1 family)